MTKIAVAPSRLLPPTIVDANLHPIQRGWPSLFHSWHLPSFYWVGWKVFAVPPRLSNRGDESVERLSSVESATDSFFGPGIDYNVEAAEYNTTAAATASSTVG